MSIVVQKGNGFTGKYTQAIIATAADWTGTAKLYSTYPDGVEKASAPLALSADGTELLFSFDAGTVLGLDAGIYSLVGNLASASLGIDTYRVDYVTVTEMQASAQPMTLLTMTIAKVDGTPTGTPTKTLTNTTSGTVLVSGWNGVKINVSHNTAYNIGTDIIGTETLTTTTNAAGYAQIAVIKGSTVTVSCPSFGKSVTVDTTGKDSIDLSEFF